MAAITANLLAATAPPLNPPAGTADLPQPTLRSTFAALFTQITSSEPTPAESETETETTDGATGSEVAAALAAIGVIQQSLEAVLTPDLDGVFAAAVTATATDPLASLPTPTLPVEQTATTPTVPTTPPSRSEQLRFTTNPAAQATQTTPTRLPEGLTTPSTPAESRAPEAVLTLARSQPLATATPNPLVTATPNGATAAAARPSSVPAQVPIVADRGQQSPALPPELGYSLVGPTVAGTPAVNPVPAVGTAASQAQVELRATTQPLLESTPPRVTEPTTVRPFPEVLAATDTPPAVTTPPTEVVTSARPDAARVPQATAAAVPLHTPTTPPAPSQPVQQGAATEATAPPTETPANVSTPTPVPTGPTGEPTPLNLSGALPKQAAVEPELKATGDTSQSAAVPHPHATPTAPPADATPLATARVAAPTPAVAAQLGEAFVTHARMVEAGGKHEFQLRLDPPELGEVKVRVLAMGDRVEARLVVSDDAVKRLIESQLPELRQRLEAAGVSVPSFDVSTDSGGRANTGRDGWDRSQPAFAPAPRPATPPPRPTPLPSPSGGVLDVTA